MSIVRSPIHQNFITFTVSCDENGVWHCEEPSDNYGFLLKEGAIDAIISACKVDKKKYKGYDRDAINRMWMLEEEERQRVEARNNPSERKNRYKKDDKCFIYLILDLSRGFHKIGKATNVQNRFAQLKTANASIELVTHYPGCDNDEKMLHKIFNERQVSGEWFDLNESHINAFHSYFNLVESVSNPS
jgi:hypothetical protein